MVGNGFWATEEVTIKIDEVVVLGKNIEVQENGRFEATVTLPANETYGEHVISVIGGETIGHGPSQAFATLEIVQFMPEKR